jgi:hypothetical protein
MKKLLSALVLVILSSSIQSQTIGGDDNNEDYWIIKDNKTIVSLNNSGQDYSPNMSIEKEDQNTKKMMKLCFFLWINYLRCL